ncbi:hypothetical protein CF319_g8019 [Tilletia indica]|nr:hypothetical protein CF319_g8019 [Tilletia indica]
MAPTTPTQPIIKNAKWATHLNLSAELVLGKAASKDNVNEVSSTMYTNDIEEHAVTLNVWARDPPEQGSYLLTNIPFATNPMRLGVGDATEMRRIPEEMDGTDPDQPTLPPSFIFLTGIGVIGAVDATRKGCTVAGFTYLNKKHGWQKFTLRLEFEETTRWAAWTVPASRTLVSFDCIVADRGSDDILKCYIRRITAIDDANRALLLALNVGSPGGGDRAERIRQARAANRSIAEAKGKAPEGSTPTLGHSSPDANGKGDDDDEDGDDSNEADEVESSTGATGKNIDNDPNTPSPRKIRRTAKAMGLN